MKRSMGGHSARGPVAPARQRRTIRLMQVLLVMAAVALLLFAGYSWGRVSGYDAGRRAEAIDAPRRPSGAQTAVLALLGGVALGGALLLQGDGSVRLPTPARLDELSGRAERSAVERAEEIASEQARARPSG